LNIYKSKRLAIVSVLFVGLLNACGGNDSTVGSSTMSCAQIAKMQIPGDSIGLPTTGALITATESVPAGGTGASAVGAYCLVSGSIMPADPAAPDIEFQVALPANWNSKVAMIGGSGFDGTIPDVTGNLQPQGAAQTALQRDYAVFASDGGHEASQLPNPASFMENDEALRNYFGDAIKKTRDVALAVVMAAYGSYPTKSYFLGGSWGGHESLEAVRRWPEDWDGAVTFYPVVAAVTQTLGWLGVSQALAAPDGYPDVAKRNVLYQAELAACDPLDGVSDGLISNVQACNITFNPRTALLNGTPIRCAGGANTGDNCLSDAELAGLAVAGTKNTFGFQLADGVQSWPGYNIFSSSTTNPFFELGSAAPGFPYTPDMPILTALVASFIPFGIAEDPSFNYLTLDLVNPGPFVSRISELSALDFPSIEMMSGFAQKGGKLLLMQGQSDLLASPRMTETYFQQLQSELGADTVDTFLRFYFVPGYGHAHGTEFNVAWDALGALENWVENGIDPKSNQVITDTVGVPGRTRPLCIYPTWAKYLGSGDVNSAASFTCVTD
jgi:Tannase and feruloyl esterase